MAVRPTAPEGQFLVTLPVTSLVAYPPGECKTARKLVEDQNRAKGDS